MSNLNAPLWQQLRFRRGPSCGFTLIEVLVTLAVFMVLGLAATRLANQSVSISIAQQAQSALNIGVRNASAQLQIDLVNAGTGYFPTYNIPGAPLGVVILPNFTPGSDKLTILSFDPTIVAHPTASPTITTSPTAQSTVTITVTPVGISAATAILNGYNWSASNPITLMLFSNTVNASSGMPTVTTFPLTAAGSPNGSNVNLTFTSNVAPVSPAGTWPGDTLGIASTYGVSDPITNPDGTLGPGICYLGTSFDSTDWLLKVSSIAYYVDTNAQLVRQVNGGTPQAIAANIIGFKVGALLYGTSSYTYGAIPDPRKIRSIRVSFIGRTTPDPTSLFRNAVDGGPYKVEGTSFIINPRNLSLHDQ